MLTPNDSTPHNTPRRDSSHREDPRHLELRDDLKAYIDGELPLLQRWIVSRHLARCESCRKEMEIMEKISQELGSEVQAASAEEALPSALKSKILSHAPAPTANAEPKFRIEMPAKERGNRYSPKSFALLGSVAAVVAVIAYTSLTGGANYEPVTSPSFNVANNALTTTDGGPDYSAGVVAQSPPSSEAEPSDVAASRAARALPSASPQSGNGFTQRMGDEANLKTRQQQGDYKTSRNMTKAAPGLGSTDDLPASLRRVHKEGRISVEVNNVEDATTDVISAIKGAGGYVATNSLSTGGDGSRSATIEGRVPVGEFENIMAQIGKKGTVKAKNVTGEDVTARYSDAQQANNVLSSELGVREAQLQDALKRAEKKDRPGQIPWQQRAEVRELRIQASQARARLEIYRRLSDMSSLSVQLQEKKHIPGQAGFLDSVSQTGHEATQTFMVAARIPISCIIWILAYSPLWLPILIGIRFLMKSQQRAS